MSAALRELLVYFGTEVDTKPLEKADDLVNTLKKGLIGLAAAFSIGAIAGELKQVANLADNINDTAAKLGFSTDALQEWQYAAKLSGIEAEALNGAIRKASMGIAEAMADATKGGAFKTLGVDLRDANDAARSTEDVFGDVIERLAAIPDEGKRAAASADIFGKSFTELNPLLAQGSDGIANLREELRKNGGLLSKKDIEAAGAFNDELDRLEAISNGAKAKILGALAPALTTVVGWLERAIPKAEAMYSSFKEWLKTSQPLRNALRFVGVLLGVIGAKSAPGLLAKGVGLLAGKWGAIRSVLGRVLMVLGRFILRMALPALLLDDLIVTFQGGDSVIRRILDSWFGKGQTAQVVNFFKGFFTGIDGLLERFGGFGEFLVETFSTIAFEVKALFIGLGASILDGVSGGWNALIQTAQDSLNKLISLANKIPGLNLDAVDFSGAKGSNDNADVAQRALSAERMGQAQRLASAADRAFGTSIADGAKVTNQVTVNVPAGTPANMANKVGNAAQRGTGQSTKAAINALKQKKA